MSDIINGKGGIVFGTAGHIDHGKTTLVRALTGIDTDRLVEEKKRGISIELGFADLTLPSQRRIAIVDVPGHERFVRNMLAGAGGIDAVLLIVAADEGVKPQTREHFDICRLLGIANGLVVLTKSDAVSPDQIECVKEDVRQFSAGSFLEHAACVPVSAHTGCGLDVLLAQMDSIVSELTPRPGVSFARLPVDRSFTMQGFGTVVTGTLLGGSLRTGESIEVHPLREQYRIRGLQVHRSAVNSAFAGQRTAVNLAGIEASEISRGFVLIEPDTVESTEIFDAEVEWLESKLATRVRQPLHLYVGALESVADVRLIETLEPERTVTRISSRKPLALLPGDRFVLRNASATVGGGVVLDPCPPVRLNRTKTRERLNTLRSSGDSGRLRLLVEESTQGRKIANLVKLTGWRPQQIWELGAADETLHICETEQRILGVAWLAQKRDSVLTWLANYHAEHPSAAGASINQIRSGVLSGIEPGIVDFILRQTSQLTTAGETVSLAGHSAQISPQDLAFRNRLEAIYRKAGFQPPTSNDALAAAGLNATNGRAHLEALVKAKQLVKVSADLIFHQDVIEHVKKSLALHKGRRFSVPEFKEWTNISRKFAIPLLEFLDRERVTRREADGRVVL